MRALAEFFRRLFRSDDWISRVHARERARLDQEARWIEEGCFQSWRANRG